MHSGKLILLGALIVLALFFIWRWWSLARAARDPDKVRPPDLAIGFGTNFFDTLGIGSFAPSLILCSLVGMNPVAAFPIMMGSCAFLMPSSGLRFIARGRYSPGASLGLALGGIPAVLLAAYVVTSLPDEWLRWLETQVVLFAATMMLRSALATPATAAMPAEGEAR